MYMIYNLLFFWRKHFKCFSLSWVDDDLKWKFLRSFDVLVMTDRETIGALQT